MSSLENSSQVVVRFPPSPTGFLHVGGARTALFNWLFAKRYGGQMLLRIEDTDRKRSEERFTDDIKESLRWLGLDWDGEPVYQSQRQARHLEVMNELLTKGLAYRCECTPEILDEHRKRAQKEKRPYRYPGLCRDKKDLPEGTAIRIRVPDSGETSFEDLVRGKITIPNKDIEDWVVCRSDGNPTYNFVVVVDDHDMGMTHILRGEDHINNTPKQALLYQALGYELPKFAHVPMILGKDKSKLSKRHGAASTLEYRKMGYLPETMVNFLVRLGWSFGDEEVFSLEDLTKKFSLDNVGKANAIFNTEKLDWLAGIHMRDKPTKDMVAYMREYFSEDLKFAEGVSPERFEAGVAIVQGKVRKIPELIEQLHCLFGEDPSYDLSKLKDDEKTRLIGIIEKLGPRIQESDFSTETLEKTIKGYAEEIGEKFGKIGKPLRFCLTGGAVSPELFDMISVQGKETVQRRMNNCLAALKGS